MNSYLHVSTEVAAVWKKRIGNDAKANIGIVWQGSTTHADDEDRSIKLDALIAALPQGPTYHTLQPDLSREDIERLAGYPNVIQWGQYLTDFEQTAGAIEAMDLIVSVDTSVAHAAAALGRPVLLLVANHPDWRWLLDRDDSPWYPSVRLVRQTEPGEWDGVMQRLPNEIQARLNRDSYRRPSH